jgi:hypothetical protein
VFWIGQTHHVGVRAVWRRCQLRMCMLTRLQVRGSQDCSQMDLFVPKCSERCGRPGRSLAAPAARVQGVLDGQNP